MKYTDVVFLTKLIPEQLRAQVDRLSSENLQEAASALQWNVYRGLCENTNCPIRLFNVLPLGSFPRYYRHPFVKSSSFLTDCCADNRNLGFCNIRMIRKLSQPGRVFCALKKWCRQGTEPKFLFVYTLDAGFLRSVSKLKKYCPELKVCAVVADLPDMISLSANQAGLIRRFTQDSAKKSYSLLNCIDFFVLLTEQMAFRMQIKKPYCVMEGIAQPSEDSTASVEAGDGIKTIFYSGTLHRQFGILNLLEAFRGIKAPNYRLMICGAGDAQAEVEAAAKQDSRIRFPGILPREEVLRYQSSATVLVNPRQNIGEYVRYSFPSKTMEYLASGRPFVAYRLDGIPKEYDPYIFYVSDNSVETLRDRLTEVCESSNSAEVIDRCTRAKQFVTEEKNAKKQTAVILKMLRSQDVEF